MRKVVHLGIPETPPSFQRILSSILFQFLSCVIIKGWIFFKRKNAGKVIFSLRCIQKYLLINWSTSLYLMPYLSFIIPLEDCMEFDLWGNQVTPILDVAWIF